MTQRDPRGVDCCCDVLGGLGILKPGLFPCFCWLTGGDWQCQGPAGRDETVDKASNGKKVQNFGTQRSLAGSIFLFGILSDRCNLDETNAGSSGTNCQVRVIDFPENKPPIPCAPGLIFAAQWELPTLVYVYFNRSERYAVGRENAVCKLLIVCGVRCEDPSAHRG